MARSLQEVAYRVAVVLGRWSSLALAATGDDDVDRSPSPPEEEEEEEEEDEEEGARSLLLLPNSNDVGGFWLILFFSVIPDAKKSRGDILLFAIWRVIK